MKKEIVSTKPNVGKYNNENGYHATVGENEQQIYIHQSKNELIVQDGADDSDKIEEFKTLEKNLACWFGIFFIVVMLGIAMVFPSPTPFQYMVFRIVLSLAASGVAAFIPGFIDVRVNNFVRAGGAIAVFVIVFFFSPADL